MPSGPPLSPGALSAFTGAAPPVPEVVLPPGEPSQASLPLASQGVLRYVWHGRFGVMLIEVAGGEVFVNGDRVEPHRP